MLVVKEMVEVVVGKSEVEGGFEANIVVVMIVPADDVAIATGTVNIEDNCIVGVAVWKFDIILSTKLNNIIRLI